MTVQEILAPLFVLVALAALIAGVALLVPPGAHLGVPSARS